MKLFGDRPHPARKAVTMAVMDVVNDDPIEAALHHSERRSIEWDREVEVASVLQRQSA